MAFPYFALKNGCFNLSYLIIDFENGKFTMLEANSFRWLVNRFNDFGVLKTCLRNLSLRLLTNLYNYKNVFSIINGRLIDIANLIEEYVERKLTHVMCVYQNKSFELAPYI